MAFAPPSIPSASRVRHNSNTNEPPCKRPSVTSAPLDFQVGAPGIFTCQASQDAFSKFNVDPKNYVFMLVPRSLANTLSEFLDNCGADIALHKHRLIPSDDDDVFDNDTSEAFKLKFANLKSDMINFSHKYKEDDLKKDVVESLFDNFKSIRTKLSKWFVPADHLANRLSSPSESNKCLKLSYDIAPNVKDDKLKRCVIEKLTRFKNSLENELLESVLGINIERCSEIENLFNEIQSTDNPDSKLLFAKAFRGLLVNKSVYNARNKRHPRQPDYNNHAPSHNNSRRKSYRNTRQPEYLHDERSYAHDNDRERRYMKDERPLYRDYDDRYQNRNYREFPRRDVPRREHYDDWNSSSRHQNSRYYLNEHYNDNHNDCYDEDFPESDFSKKIPKRPFRPQGSFRNRKTSTYTKTVWKAVP